MDKGTLAERLRAAREEKGWSKAELRRRAGVGSPSTLTELETGEAKASPQIPAIALALGVEAVWLQYGQGPKERTLAAAPSAAPSTLTNEDPVLVALATLPPEEADAWRARIVAAAAEHRAEVAREKRRREGPPAPKARLAG